MSGAGTLNTQSKSVTAAGTFTHKSSDGTVLEAGVWIVSELVSFDSYGIAPGALLHGARALGPATVRPQRFADVLWPHANRRSRGIPYPPLADEGSNKNSGAASELRPGKRAPRTFRWKGFDSPSKVMVANFLRR